VEEVEEEATEVEGIGFGREDRRAWDLVVRAVGLEVGVEADG